MRGLSGHERGRAFLSSTAPCPPPPPFHLSHHNRNQNRQNAVTSHLWTSKAIHAPNPTPSPSLSASFSSNAYFAQYDRILCNGCPGCQLCNTSSPPSKSTSGAAQNVRHANAPTKLSSASELR